MKILKKYKMFIEKKSPSFVEWGELNKQKLQEIIDDHNDYYGIGPDFDDEPINKPKPKEIPKPTKPKENTRKFEEIKCDGCVFYAIKEDERYYSISPTSEIVKTNHDIQYISAEIVLTKNKNLLMTIYDYGKVVKVVKVPSVERALKYMTDEFSGDKDIYDEEIAD